MEEPKYSGFFLSQKDRETTSTWFHKHLEEGCKNTSGPTNRIVQKLDGLIRIPLYSPIFQFVSTGIGSVNHVKCVCGAELDFSDYDSW